MRPILSLVLGMMVAICPARAAGHTAASGIAREIFVLSPGAHHFRVQSPELIRCYLARNGEVLADTQKGAHTCALSTTVPSGGGAYQLTVIHVTAEDDLADMTPMSYTLTLGH